MDIFASTNIKFKGCFIAKHFFFLGLLKESAKKSEHEDLNLTSHRLGALFLERTTRYLLLSSYLDEHKKTVSGLSPSVMNFKMLLWSLVAISLLFVHPNGTEHAAPRRKCTTATATFRKRRKLRIRQCHAKTGRRKLKPLLFNFSCLDRERIFFLGKVVGWRVYVLVKCERNNWESICFFSTKMSKMS